jgi:diketogulonate reductase-like aldo/keto reductase
VVGEGTWNMELDDRKAAIAGIRAALDAGATHVDTAELYGDGEVETLVGEALQGRRDEIFLVSKVLPQNASRRGTIEACERSLRRLRTDRLDAYLLHWPGDEPLEDTIEAFEELVRRGKIVRWGLSNFDVPDLEAAAAIAGSERIAYNQVLYHLGERAIEHTVLPWCRRHGIAVVAYSPFGSGDFPTPRSRGGRVLAEVASTLDATPRQIALAFLLRHEGTFVIPKASNAEHARDNAGAGRLRLGAVELEKIEAAFPKGRPRSLPVL